MGRPEFIGLRKSVLGGVLSQEELKAAEKEIKTGKFISNAEVEKYLSSWGKNHDSKK